MTWETFYLVCFLAGLLLSGVSLLGAMGHFGTHIAPHSVHVPHLPHPGHVAPPTGTPHSFVQGSGTVRWWNSFSIMVFLCWFGAAGYLLTRHSSFVALFVLLVSVVCGLAGGALVILFLAKVMLPHEHELSADETAVVGAVGTVTCAIRPEGTGEIVYEQLGARRSAPARSDDGTAIERNVEVFVVRYEKGVAYVRRWEDESE
jgi:membrane protein implicated in regulation of membrane protease activity